MGENRSYGQCCFKVHKRLYMTPTRHLDAEVTSCASSNSLQHGVMAPSTDPQEPYPPHHRRQVQDQRVHRQDHFQQRIQEQDHPLLEKALRKVRKARAAGPTPEKGAALIPTVGGPPKDNCCSCSARAFASFSVATQCRICSASCCCAAEAHFRSRGSPREQKAPGRTLPRGPREDTASSKNAATTTSTAAKYVRVRITTRTATKYRSNNGNTGQSASRTAAKNLSTA